MKDYSTTIDIINLTINIAGKIISTNHLSVLLPWSAHYSKIYRLMSINDVLIYFSIPHRYNFLESYQVARQDERIAKKVKEIKNHSLDNSQGERDKIFITKKTYTETESKHWQIQKLLF